MCGSSICFRILYQEKESGGNVRREKEENCRDKRKVDEFDKWESKRDLWERSSSKWAVDRGGIHGRKGSVVGVFKSSGKGCLTQSKQNSTYILI